MNSHLVSLIKRFEGLHKLVKGRVYPYLCPAGYPTQGYGLLVKSLKEPDITPLEAELRMLQALPKYMADTFKACPRLLLEPPEYQAAIVDFCFNLGAARLRGSTLRRKINDGDWQGACRELEKWVNGGGRRLPGLVLRRSAEINLIRKAMQ